VTPWLSVIVPVHEGRDYLPATLASAADELPDGVEFLVYDSGHDGGACQRIVADYAGRLDIRWRATPDIKPWTAKTNLGVREARAPHVCMLHQDDLWLPGHLTAVMAAIARHPASLSIAASQFASATGELVGKWDLPFRPGAVSQADFLATLLVQNSIAVPSPVIPRAAWLACGGMDEALWYTADWDLYLRLAAECPIHVRPEKTTAFRLHGSSLTMTGSRKAAEFREQLEIVLRRHLDAVPASLRRRAGRLARASVDINCSLAAASAFGAATALLRLGPSVPAYLRQSRIVDRLMPRVRLSLSGAM
jgi:hypothetical protein